ncbi:hypothetical protein C5167_014468 [Papaver somniferum]|uniref:Glutamine amidotransferase domain-containing protein n=1 Tax=Papaver somniferum TaxID=3469 RepID=A0A4Y7J3A3_PAPSO|nr:hypothetical protein C5167_014468 [Papaver somniferum]
MGRFGVLLNAKDLEFVKKRYGGYFGVFVRMLGEEGETWDMFKVCSGEFPKDEELESFGGFVITGSCSDAHGNDLWIVKLLNLLKKLDSLKKRVSGICFGHQVFCIHRALILIKITSQRHAYPESLKIPTTLSVIEFHRDEVRELPPSAKVMAWSSKTGVEVFMSGDHMMGIQGHPEYTKDILLNLIDRLLDRNLIQDSHAETAKASVEATEPSREAWMKLCRSFLKGRLVL